MENLKISDNYRKIENEKTEEKNEKKKDEKKDEKEELTDLDILTS